MAGLLPDRVLEVPGRLIKSPTDMSDSADDYGGTALGFVSELQLRPIVTYEPIIAEEYGEEIVDIIEVRGGAVLSCVFRQWDPDAIASVFPNTTATSGGQRRIQMPASSPAGLLAASGITLLFAPLDPLSPGILAFRAVPALSLAGSLPAAMNFERGDELNFAAVFYLLRGSAGNAVYVDLLENLEDISL